MFLRFLCAIAVVFALYSEEEIERVPLTPPEYLASLTTDSSHLIGGVISPFSGQPVLQQTDFIVHGAQDLELTRVYVPMTTLASYDSDSKRDRLALYDAMRANLKGWIYFPHLRVRITRGNPIKVRVSESNGATLEFQISNSVSSLVPSPCAFTNVAGEIPSGKYDPRNIKVQIDASGAYTIVTLPDGTVRNYRKARPAHYILETEILPNGKHLRYHYNDLQLISIQSLDPKERYVYAQLQVQPGLGFAPAAFTSSTGQTAQSNYIQTTEEFKFKEKKHGRKWKEEYIAGSPPYLLSVNSPEYRQEAISYTNRYQLQSYSSKDHVFSCTYAPFASILRVQHLSFPTHHTSTHSMHYAPVNPGVAAGCTTVYNADGTSLIYDIAANYLLTSIRYFNSQGALVKQKKYTWAPNGFLSALDILDAQGTLLYRKAFTCDAYGNPLTETISGQNSEPYTITRTYSQDGRNLLLSEKPDLGPEIRMTYVSGTNLLASRTTDLKRELFEYDDCLNLVRITTTDGHETLITSYRLRQASPFLHMPEWIEETYLEGNQGKLLKKTHLIYDSWGNVAEEEIFGSDDIHAYTLYKTYNERSDLLTETNALGQKAQATYTSRGQRETHLNSSGRLKKTYTYDGKGRQIVLSENHRTEAFTYDALDNLTSKTDHFGNATTYTYDPIARKPITTAFNNAITHDAYNLLGHPLSHTDATGYATHYEPNLYGDPLAIHHPDGALQTCRYRSDGKLLWEKDPDGLETRYDYDLFARLVRKTSADSEEIWEYDTFHLLSHTDPEGRTARYTYDGAGRKISEDFEGRRTDYFYDALNRLVEIRKDDLLIVYERDLLDRTLDEKHLSGNTLFYRISYAYDADGNRAATTRYIHNTPSQETQTCDPFGRLTASTDPLGNSTTTEYFENKVLQTIQIDPLGIQTITEYDPFGRVALTETPQASKTTFVYNPHGDLLFQHDLIFLAGKPLGIQTTAFTTDSRHFIISETRAFGTPDARTVQYTYTPGGKRSSKTTPDGVVLSYTYNPLGFLAALTSSDGTIHHTFTTDRLGNILKAVTDQNTITRDYDLFGNAVRDNFPTFFLDKTYDRFDRLTALHLPDDSSIVYTYDARYLRSVERKIWTGDTRYYHTFDEYDLSGRLLKEILLGRLGFFERTYDAKGRPLTLDSRSFSQTAAYDAADNLIATTINGIPYAYDYDGLHQISSEAIDTTTHAYSHDSLYRRHEKDGEASSFNDLSELQSQGATQCSYDLRGNLISKTTREGTTTYTYDALNQLISAETPTQKIEMTYDAFGRRLTKTVCAKTSRGYEQITHEAYLYDGDHEIGMFSPDGTIEQLRILGQRPSRGLATTLAIELGIPCYAAVCDLQNNIYGLIHPTDPDKDQYYPCTAFGESLHPALDAPFNPWRYASKRLDPELGLVYFGKRYYDPSFARWLTTDPSGFTDSVNMYQYVFNNPYLYYDPDGQFAGELTFDFLKVAFGVVGLAITSPIWAPAAAVTLTLAAVIYVGSEIYKQNPEAFAIPDSIGTSPAHDYTSAARGKESSSGKGKNNNSKKDKEKKSSGNLQKQVEQGKSPKSVDRVDKGRGEHEKDHVHFKDGSALNSDGTWKHGGRELTRQEADWLNNNGWNTP